MRTLAAAFTALSIILFGMGSTKADEVTFLIEDSKIKNYLFDSPGCGAIVPGGIQWVDPDNLLFSVEISLSLWEGVSNETRRSGVFTQNELRKVMKVAIVEDSSSIIVDGRTYTIYQVWAQVSQTGELRKSAGWMLWDLQGSSCLASG